MEDYMDHKQESLWVCNTHWVMNSNEKAIMKFQRAKTLFFLHWIQTPCHKAPYPVKQHDFLEFFSGELM